MVSAHAVVLTTIHIGELSGVVVADIHDIAVVSIVSHEVYFVTASIVTV